MHNILPHIYYVYLMHKTMHPCFIKSRADLSTLGGKGAAAVNLLMNYNGTKHNRVPEEEQSGVRLEYVRAEKRGSRESGDLQVIGCIMKKH